MGISKNILITCPTMNIHGGVRVLVEWANHLSRRGHRVIFHVVKDYSYTWDPWIEFDKDVKLLVGPKLNYWGCEIIIASTPALALSFDRDKKVKSKKFYFLQMAEHYFNNDPAWHKLCIDSYKVEMPIIGISKWVEEDVRQYRGDGTMYYVGNGVSDDFKPGTKDEGLTILVEGWGGYPGNSSNAKDVDLLGPRVAEVLHKEYGAKIIAFSQFALSRLSHAKQYEYILSEYHEAPSREELVRLYQRPTFMLKASKYDARSCAPVEAMKCGTVTVRAIERGDDDLAHQLNCLKCGYDFDFMLENAKLLVENPDFIKYLWWHGLKYAMGELNWETRMNEIENILLNG